MTEKEFKKIIVDYEQSKEQKELQLSLIQNVVETIQNNVFSTITLEASFQSGINGLNKLETELEMCVVLDSKCQNESFEKRILLNTVESILLLNFEKLSISSVEKNILTNIIKVKLENDIYINIKVLSKKEESKIIDEQNKVKIIELINQKFTLYKNTLALIKYYKLTEDLKELNDYLLSIILAYSLEKYQADNKYYKYLNAFIKGLDDFLNGKKISLLNTYITSSKELNTNFKYIVVDPVNYEENVASMISETTLGDYRKLRKKISKELESSVDLGYTFDNSVEVVIDIEPLQKDDTYAWRFEIVGKDLKNQANEYASGIENYHNALLKGTFKGLKSLIQNGLVKKKIYILSSFGDIFNSSILSNDENKSRVKTIKALIEQNKLNIICISKPKE
ncbi:MAG: hypothetical protein IJD76_04535 [Bacilli bacterium]|nr:hypothetical protein [Bacilli bacterium]